MRFSSLGSGSEGNALVVEVVRSGALTRVMLDCGFNLKECERRLARLEIGAETLNGIVVTHEHTDHLSGVLGLARRYRIPVWSTHGTLAAVLESELEGIDIHTIFAASPFEIDAIGVTPFAVPHDAREPVHYVFTDGQARLGVLTDIGHATPHVVQMLSGLDALVLECNHDLEMLERSDYPAALKARIRGAYGHLDNDSAARLLAALERSRLGCVVAAHLSRRNNTKPLARTALAGVLKCDPDSIRIADQDAGLAWTDV